MSTEQLDPASLTALDFTHEGDGRLQLVHNSGPNGRPLTPGTGASGWGPFFDTETEDECAPVALADGGYACVPASVLTGHNGSESIDYYADDSCQQPLASANGKPDFWLLTVRDFWEWDRPEHL